MTLVELVTAEGAVAHIDASTGNGGLWLTPADLKATVGFELKPEGLCRDELCYPLPRGREAEFVADGRVNLEALWRLRGGEVVATAARDVWLLGDATEERRMCMDAFTAPDFTLPDRDGQLHTLSDYRGRKVFLATWASW